MRDGRWGTTNIKNAQFIVCCICKIQLSFANVWINHIIISVLTVRTRINIIQIITPTEKKNETLATYYISKSNVLGLKKCIRDLRSRQSLPVHWIPSLMDEESEREEKRGRRTRSSSSSVRRGNGSISLCTRLYTGGEEPQTRHFMLCGYNVISNNSLG